MSRQPTFTRRSLYHGWLPANPQIHRAFLDRHVLGVTLNAPNDWNGWATEFIDTIQASEVMSPLMDLIFKQVNKDDKWAASDEKYRVRDIDHLRDSLTSVTQGPPEVYIVRNLEGEKVGEPIGVPIYLILDLLSNTSAAYDLFRLKEFNNAMRTFLNKWGNYLANDSRSNSTLTQAESGWFGSYALNVLEQGLQGQSFEQTYGVKPAEAQQAYKTWDNFFIRPFKNIEEARPVVQVARFPAIYNACESTSLRTAHNVKLDDTFWLKGQNYSLYDMFGGNPAITPESLSAYAQRFVGGSVYQAFLSPQDYHHWHSPVKGKILEATDLQSGDPHGAMIRTQPWLSVAAARGVIIIQPEEPTELEWVAFIGIGMVEVSTIDLAVSKDGSGGKPNHVEAGDHLGMFHFGGSSHISS
ncbi:phosphatidylserine decarboxylase [Butyriboletus roseoflavus]|nr:phosphatidylserine decarboxylase [Butyriboletus roseoflavus]